MSLLYFYEYTLFKGRYHHFTKEPSNAKLFKMLFDKSVFLKNSQNQILMDCSNELM